MDALSDEPPAEAALIRKALRRARLSGREAARRSGLSETRWRQIANGYQEVGRGVRVTTQAPDDTLARVAQVLGITSAELREARRGEAADLLDELTGPPASPSSNTPGAEGQQVEAIAALLATLSPEARDQVLSRFGRQTVDGAAAENPPEGVEHRRAV